MAGPSCSIGGPSSERPDLFVAFVADSVHLSQIGCAFIDSHSAAKSARRPPETFKHSLLLRFWLQPQFFESLSFFDFEIDVLIMQDVFIVISLVIVVLASERRSES